MQTKTYNRKGNHFLEPGSKEKNWGLNVEEGGREPLGRDSGDEGRLLQSRTGAGAREAQCFLLCGSAAGNIWWASVSGWCCRWKHFRPELCLHPHRLYCNVSVRCCERCQDVDGRKSSAAVTSTGRVPLIFGHLAFQTVGGFSDLQILFGLQLETFSHSLV